RRQQRRRPRSVSGLIRDHPQTSQHTKSQKIRKSDKLLNLKDSLQTIAETDGFPCFSHLAPDAAALFRL
ncbi:hypothetical protein, partial [Agrobacterium burrii]